MCGTNKEKLLKSGQDTEGVSIIVYEIANGYDVNKQSNFIRVTFFFFLRHETLKKQFCTRSMIM